MPTYRKRGTKWSYRIDIGKDPLTNERRQLTVSYNAEFPGGFKTKIDAKAAATKHQYELDHGTYVKVKDILFVDFAKEWFKHYSRGKKISTVRVRKSQLLYFTKHFEFEKLKDINKKKYQGFLDDMFEKGYAYNNIVGVHSAGLVLFSFAMEFEYIKSNPTQYAKVPKSQETVEDIENKIEIPKYLEKEQLALFLRTAKEKGLDGDYLIFLILAYSGIRVGELCALKKTDFDTEEKTVSITKTYFTASCRVKDFELLPPKNKSSIRKIELDSIVFEALESHLTKQLEVKMLHRKTYYDKGFVFANKDEYPGYPFNIDKVEYRMGRLLKLAKLDENLTPHSLRHTHTSLCAEAGVPLEDIMDRLGHQDDKTTKLVYMHVTKTRKKDASHKFGELMKNL